VPRVLSSHSTARVLTSEYVAGRRFDEILDADEQTRNRFGEILYRFVFGSIIRHGSFNADPHPGNCLYDEQGRVVILDYGCVKYFPTPMLANWIELVRAHMDGDRARFRARAVDAGFLRDESPVAADLLYDYFGYFYEAFRHDRVFTYTREYNAESLSMVFAPKGRFEGLTKRINMPRDFTLVNRLTWGVTSILAQLGATANWHRIHREFTHGDAPSTELGTIDAAFRAAA
jgi:predicted unusual protein kinase regulating ubiquinone biosynthesis (AarF/ABC1/UbiB family)